jgi:TolB-like protein/DNA-binding winged helix-turn-helix (wHTH) protein/Flp pilus assembly protein TadD
MNVNADLHKPFRVGDWEVHPQENRLRRAGEERTLEPKVMDVLVLLAGNSGKVVSREQLLDSVWAGVVVGDEAVSRAISLLRTALGDDQKHPVYLKTVPKRGYCILASVAPLAADGSNESGTSRDLLHLRNRAGRTRKLGFIAVTVLALAIGYFAYDQSQIRSEPDEPLEGAGISIAVRPFVSMSDDFENTYFADGLSEDLLNLLVSVPAFRVVGRNSSFSFKDKDVDAAQIGEELGVSYVLEGSVRMTADHIRVTARLIEAKSALHLWSATFDREPGDVFAVQDEIATAVVKALRIELLDDMPTPHATDPEVYALYLQGLYFENQKGIEGYRKSAEALTAALDIDPEYAPAWVALSRVWTYQVRAGVLPRERGRTLAMTAARNALDRDPKMASAWSSLAYLKSYYDWDWDGAVAALDRALELEPNNAQVLGVAASLAGRLGRMASATELHERALAQDPLNLTALSAMGQDYLRNGRPDDAIRVFSRLVTLSPGHYSGRINLGRAYLLKGDIEQARKEIDKSRSESLKTYEKIQIYLALEDYEEVQALVRAYLEKHSRVDIVRTAALFASLGDNDSAFEWLEIAYERRDPRLTWILVNVDLSKLRNDARYPVFLEKIGLREAWEAMPHGMEAAQIIGTNSQQGSGPRDSAVVPDYRLTAGRRWQNSLLAWEVSGYHQACRV